ncbi:MAG TPA: hypothetical protein VFE60_15170, partial [Roseiarcus sp.]|nr:hypothetical protein [Roseiarcus sp.]
MPKRGIDAASRCFFDELLSLDAARLRASGAIRLEDRHGVIAFGDEDHGLERRKCIGVAHTKFPNGGSWSYFICLRCGGRKKKLWLIDVAHTQFPNGGAWSYFICPRCGGRKKKLWLVEDAPHCLSCCW